MEMKLLSGLVALACFFFSAAESDAGCNCDDNLTTVCIPVGKDLLVPCPYVNSTLQKFKLLHNGNITFIRKYPYEGPAHLPEGDMKVQLITGKDTFNIRVGNVNGSSYGIYRCDAEVILQPPRFTQRGNERILLLVEEHQCRSRKEVEGEAVKEPEETPCLLVWIPIVTIVSLYSLIVTITLVVCCMRFRTLANDNEYMNTKPPMPRAHWWKA